MMESPIFAIFHYSTNVVFLGLILLLFAAHSPMLYFPSYKIVVQMLLPYSRCGRTILLYNVKNISLSMCVNDRLINPNFLLAFFTDEDICCWNFSCLSTITPRSFSCVVFSISLRPRLYVVFVSLPIWRCLHLDRLKRKSQVSDQFIRLSKSSWSLHCCSSLFTTEYIFVSSAKSFTTLSTTSGRSFIYNKNNVGPSTLPWGMPLVTACHSDSFPFKITRCCLSVK